jgi:transposase-like protein
VKKARKNYTPQEKVVVLRRHLIDKIAVSDLCDEYRLQPTVFYRWLKEFFENGSAAFERKPQRLERRQSEQQRKITALEAKLQKKDEVLAEVMQEYVGLKKELGEI